MSEQAELFRAESDGRLNDGLTVTWTADGGFRFATDHEAHSLSRDETIRLLIAIDDRIGSR